MMEMLNVCQSDDACTCTREKDKARCSIEGVCVCVHKSAHVHVRVCVRVHKSAHVHVCVRESTREWMHMFMGAMQCFHISRHYGKIKSS